MEGTGGVHVSVQGASTKMDPGPGAPPPHAVSRGFVGHRWSRGPGVGCHVCVCHGVVMQLV